MFKDFQWPKPEEEADEKLIHNVREHGCHILGVDDQPPFSFSIGLALNYGQAEIVIFGLEPPRPPRSSTSFAMTRPGKKILDGDISSDILVNGKVCFVEVPLGCMTNIWERRSGSTANRPGRFPAFNSYGRIVREISLGNRIRSDPQKDQPILKTLS